MEDTRVIYSILQVAGVLLTVFSALSPWFYISTPIATLQFYPFTSSPAPLGGRVPPLVEKAFLLFLLPLGAITGIVGSIFTARGRRTGLDMAAGGAGLSMIGILHAVISFWQLVVSSFEQAAKYVNIGYVTPGLAAAFIGAILMALPDRVEKYWPLNESHAPTNR